MEEHSLGETLFMSIAGIIFIIGSIICIYAGIKIIIEENFIKANGIEVEAIITYKSVYQKKRAKESMHQDNYAHYSIQYEVNGKKYTDYFRSTSYQYYKGDVIKIYCLENNPEKIYNHLEKGEKITQVIMCIIIAITLIKLGNTCIKEYNIFKYRRSINVE